MKNKIKIIRKNVKNITLRVKSTTKVILTVPASLDEEYIDNFIKKKEAWIKKQVKWFNENYNPVEEYKQYVSGESFEYLGKRYRLKVIENSEESVKLYRGYIYLRIKGSSDLKRKKNLVDKWYREKASIKFNEVIESYKHHINEEFNSIRIQKMKTHWGSCSSKRNITLNLELIKKPKYCIEYVILHEMTHLIYMNHSKDFYDYMTVRMPDWKWRKDKLEERR
jgi:predicted metal-dependent hydrolase